VRPAGESGLTVLAGRAVAGGAPTPFRPFAEALTSAGRAGRLPASEELGPFRPLLGRLIPEWRPPQPVPGEETPVFLGEAVLRLLRILAPQAGCVLVLTYLLGRESVRVYDGSWAEWGRMADAPVEQALPRIARLPRRRFWR
jgi:hypothetical protein